MAKKSKEMNTSGAEPVADKIMGSFLDELAAIDGFKEVSERLRQTILVERQLTENPIRKALFNTDA